jgi:hypothetical protein
MKCTFLGFFAKNPEIEPHPNNRFLCLSERQIILDLLYGFGKDVQIEFGSQLPGETESGKFDLIDAVNPDPVTAAALF